MKKTKISTAFLVFRILTDRQQPASSPAPPTPDVSRSDSDWYFAFVWFLFGLLMIVCYSFIWWNIARSRAFNKTFFLLLLLLFLFSVPFEFHIHFNAIENEWKLWISLIVFASHETIRIPSHSIWCRKLCWTWKCWWFFKSTTDGTRCLLSHRRRRQRHRCPLRSPFPLLHAPLHSSLFLCYTLNHSMAIALRLFFNIFLILKLNVRRRRRISFTIKMEKKMKFNANGNRENEHFNPIFFLRVVCGSFALLFIRNLH